MNFLKEKIVGIDISEHASSKRIISTVDVDRLK